MIVIKECKKVRNLLVIRSTTPSRPNKVGFKCTSVRLSIKSLLDFNEIWCVGRGR